MFSKKEKSIICKLFLAYLIIISFGLLIYYWLTKNPCIDKSAMTNIFVWSATLFAPITALLLLNAWKYQYRINLINATALETCKLLEKSERELMIFEDLLPHLKVTKPSSINSEIIKEINQLPNTIYESTYGISRLEELVKITPNIEDKFQTIIDMNYNLSKQIKEYIATDNMGFLNGLEKDINPLADAISETSVIMKTYIKEDIEI